MILLSGVEFWERVGFFGLMGLFILFLTAPESEAGLGWPQARAMSLFGVFFAGMWILPIIGGWLADRVMGQRLAVRWGLVLMMLGYFLMAGVHRMGPASFYTALTLILAGNALFKPTLVALVGRFYERRDPRRESGYTILYLCINVGNFLGNIVVGGLLGEKLGWHYGFAAAGIGMLVGLLILMAFRRATLGDVGEQPVEKGEGSETIAPRLTAGDIDRFKALGIVMVLFALFIAGYGQLANLINHYVETDVARHVAGFQVPATWFISLNALFIILLGPLLAHYWTRLGKARRNPDPLHKYMLGMGLVAAGFAMLGLGSTGAASGMAAASAWWVVLFYFLFTLGELMIFPIFLSLVPRLAPQRFSGMATGFLFAAAGVGFYLSGKIGAQSAAFGVSTILFALANGAVVACLLAFLLRPLFLRWSGD